MKAYLITMIILGYIALLQALYRLLQPHPRIPAQVTLENDVLAVLVSIGFLGWVSYLVYSS